MIYRYDLRADSFDIEVRKAQHDAFVNAVEIIITHYVLQIVSRKVRGVKETANPVAAVVDERALVSLLYAR